ncbi:serine acetyltransferase [Pseudenhygromyxa sp. WMMC2535]|uniref:serine O-acetyltransferase n=1 Tax=Pseudenhygromyxa sp. WMMC2535 TaxID=2712867 RepID=UPI001552D030|nr:serine acetyltransferase [Pseudenhygromyxa sp. WMMC2535]NVB37809.1 serine acetyltransferase [Pseudenhygromyxa sp. WMMC2535]
MRPKAIGFSEVGFGADDLPRATSYSAEVPDIKRQLATAIDGILGSYQEHGNINHLDGSNLPSRAEIGQLLDDLLSLIFPGYLGAEEVDELSSRYFVGERCVRSLRSLERVIARATNIQRERRSCTAEIGAVEAHEHAIDLLAHIPEIRGLLATDVRAAIDGDPAACSRSEVITAYPGITAIAVHRIAHHLYRRGVPMIPRMMTELVHGRTGIDIHPGATIGESFFIDHGTGVVIGETTVIGARVKLYQGVTLGALSVDVSERARGRKRHPTLEDEVTVYAGTTILGGETVIGRGSVIGGNVWLTHSVAPRSTVMLDKPSLRIITHDE